MFCGGSVWSIKTFNASMLSPFRHFNYHIRFGIAVCVSLQNIMIRHYCMIISRLLLGCPIYEENWYLFVHQLYVSLNPKFKVSFEVILTLNK